MADPEQAPSTAPTSSRSVSGSTSSPSSCSGSCGARRPPTHRLASLCRCIQGVRIHWPPCTISTHGRALDLATKWACSADLSREGLPSRREERPVMSRSTSTVRLTCVALGRRANGWPIGHHATRAHGCRSPRCAAGRRRSRSRGAARADGCRSSPALRSSLIHTGLPMPVAVAPGRATGHAAGPGRAAVPMHRQPSRAGDDGHQVGRAAQETGERAASPLGERSDGRAAFAPPEAEWLAWRPLPWSRGPAYFPGPLGVCPVPLSARVPLLSRAW